MRNATRSASTPSRSAWSSATTATSCARARSCRLPTRRTLRDLNKELSSLSTTFRSKLLAGTKAARARSSTIPTHWPASATPTSPPRRKRPRRASSTANGWSRCRTRRSSRRRPRSRSAMCAKSCSMRRSTAPSTATTTTRARRFRASPNCAPRRRKLLGLQDLRRLRPRRSDGEDARRARSS